MNILFLSGHLPSPTARQAGQKISYRLCEYLARRHRLQLLAFATASELQCWSQDAARIFTSHMIVPVTPLTRLLGVALSPAAPLSVAARNHISLRRAFASILGSKQHDVVIFDHMASWQYANHTATSAFRVGIAHDVLSQLWARRASRGGGIAARFESRRLRNWERNAIRGLDLVCTLNRKDSQLIAELGEGVPQCVLQPWFSRPLDPAQSAATKEAASLVFSGALDRHENVDAVKFAIGDILPRITAMMPQCTFHLTGFAGGSLPRRVAGHPAVRIAGLLPDLPEFLGRMQIALLPLRLGAGLKIKVLECMAAGLPVVTTPIGAEGISAEDGVHFLLGHTAEELARHVIHLLRSQPLRARIGGAAREFVQANYDFEASAREFEQLLMRRVNRQQPRALQCDLAEDNELAGDSRPSQAASP